MGFLAVERGSDSPYIEAIMQGRSVGEGLTTRPAECHWHMVFTTYKGAVQPIFVGALTTAGVLPYVDGIELLWIKFRIGTCMPHLPAKQFVNVETTLPDASSQSFWLKGSAWQFPSYENVETFVDRLVREEILVRDPVVDAALRDEPAD